MPCMCQCNPISTGRTTARPPGRNSMVPRGVTLPNRRKQCLRRSMVRVLCLPMASNVTHLHQRTRKRKLARRMLAGRAAWTSGHSEAVELYILPDPFLCFPLEKIPLSYLTSALHCVTMRPNPSRQSPSQELTNQRGYLQSRTTYPQSKAHLSMDSTCDVAC